ncbi:Peptide-methionine (S)-S-oxide reductase [Linnemannia zychae]|nr:Peptide-methionine (S)-S-oxide reductase [Linnemannia zychae]
MPPHLQNLLPFTASNALCFNTITAKPITTNKTEANDGIIYSTHTSVTSNYPMQSTTAVQQLHQLQQRYNNKSNSPRISTTSSINLESLLPEKSESNHMTQSTSLVLELPVKTERATFAAGCFWGVEKAFQKHFKNDSIKTRVGYIGGIDAFPTYKKVCSGLTHHAEALQIEYTPSITISYPILVEFFYRMHDPTTLNSQGPDRGTQYRSAIFAHTPEQHEIARHVTQTVQESHYKNKRIVTEVVYKEGKANSRGHGYGAGALAWYDAEEYHQNYLYKNPRGYECPSHFLRW